MVCRSGPRASTSAIWLTASNCRVAGLLGRCVMAGCRHSSKGRSGRSARIVPERAHFSLLLPCCKLPTQLPLATTSRQPSPPAVTTTPCACALFADLCSHPAPLPALPEVQHSPVQTAEQRRARRSPLTTATASPPPPQLCTMAAPPTDAQLQQWFAVRQERAASVPISTACAQPVCHLGRTSWQADLLAPFTPCCCCCAYPATGH